MIAILVILIILSIILDISIHIYGWNNFKDTEDYTNYIHRNMWVIRLNDLLLKVFLFGLLASLIIKYI